MTACSDPSCSSAVLPFIMCSLISPFVTGCKGNSIKRNTASFFPIRTSRCNTTQHFAILIVWRPVSLISTHERLTNTPKSLKVTYNDVKSHSGYKRVQASAHRQSKSVQLFAGISLSNSSSSTGKVLRVRTESSTSLFRTDVHVKIQKMNAGIIQTPARLTYRNTNAIISREIHANHLLCSVVSCCALRLSIVQCSELSCSVVIAVQCKAL